MVNHGGYSLVNQCLIIINGKSMVNQYNVGKQLESIGHNGLIQWDIHCITINVGKTIIKG